MQFTQGLKNMSELPFAVTRPAYVERVGLKSRDAQALADYYQQIVGLREMARRGSSIILGAGDLELLEIEQSSALKQDDPRSAGLFHTAFLLPQRADLARWIRHAIDKQLPVAGASDHAVSEAVYLTDPDGNGIEIYTDRTPDTWQWQNGQVHMVTDAMDVNGILQELQDNPAQWSQAPQGTVVGHVHLRVGQIQPAEDWWYDEMALDTVAHYGSKAVFLSSGGYHHHIANNIWQSAGAGKRDLDRSGLAFVQINDRRDGVTRIVEDPWGNEIRINKI